MYGYLWKENQICASALKRRNEFSRVAVIIE